MDEYSQPEDTELAFVITSLDGEILNTVKFSDYGKFDIAPKNVYEEELFNLYFVKNDTDFTDVYAYFLLKRGSEIRFEANTANIKTSLNNISITINSQENSFPFEYLTVTADWGGRTFSTTDDFSAPLSFNYTDESKLLLLVQNPNEAYFAIKDIPENTDSMVVDIIDCTTPALLKEIEVPENSSGYILAFGRPDHDYDPAYFLTDKSFYGSTLKFFYPDFPIEKYTLLISSSNDKWRYYVSSYGNIPDKVVPFQITTNIVNSTAGDFKAAFGGEFDYYRTKFFNEARNVRLTTYAPSHLNQFKVADLSTTLNLPNIKTDDLRFDQIRIVDIVGHKEDQKYFKYYNKYPHPLFPLIYYSYYSLNTPEGRKKSRKKAVEEILSEFYDQSYSYDIGRNGS